MNALRDRHNTRQHETFGITTKLTCCNINTQMRPLQKLYALEEEYTSCLSLRRSHIDYLFRWNSISPNLYIILFSILLYPVIHVRFYATYEKLIILLLFKRHHEQRWAKEEACIYYYIVSQIYFIGGTGSELIWEFFRGTLYM